MQRGDRRDASRTASPSCSTSAPWPPAPWPTPTSPQLRAQMDEARARRLQPHYIERAFREAFTRLGGRIAEAGGRPLRDHQRPGRDPRQHARGRSRPGTSGSPSRPIRSTRRPTRAELLAPGHPLHDAVMREDHRATSAPRSTAAPCWSRPRVEEPRLLVGVIEEVVRRDRRRRSPAASATPTSTRTAR